MGNSRFNILIKVVMTMTEQELLSHKRITPEIAAKYLQDGITAQEIRVKARYGLSDIVLLSSPPESDGCTG